MSNYSFTGFYFREALPVENKIVNFGSNFEKKTYVLEQEEDSELKLVREDEGFDLLRGYYSTASCFLKNEIYAFKTWNYTDVHRYSLESGKWSLYFKK